MPNPLFKVTLKRNGKEVSSNATPSSKIDESQPLSTDSHPSAHKRMAIVVDVRTLKGYGFPVYDNRQVSRSLYQEKIFRMNERLDPASYIIFTTTVGSYFVFIGYMHISELRVDENGCSVVKGDVAHFISWRDAIDLTYQMAIRTHQWNKQLKTIDNDAASLFLSVIGGYANVIEQCIVIVNSEKKLSESTIGYYGYELKRNVEAAHAQWYRQRPRSSRSRSRSSASTMYGTGLDDERQDEREHRFGQFDGTSYGWDDP